MNLMLNAVPVSLTSCQCDLLCAEPKAAVPGLTPLCTRIDRGLLWFVMHYLHLADGDWCQVNKGEAFLVSLLTRGTAPLKSPNGDHQKLSWTSPKSSQHSTQYSCLYIVLHLCKHLCYFTCTNKKRKRLDTWNIIWSFPPLPAFQILWGGWLRCPKYPYIFLWDIATPKWSHNHPGHPTGKILAPLLLWMQNTIGWWGV